VKKYVLFYESADDVASRAPEHFPAHSARCQEFHARGLLLMVGTFADPQTDGAGTAGRSRSSTTRTA
jgi:uncharacterized protein YciI